jgi:hypothetical protein
MGGVTRKFPPPYGDEAVEEVRSRLGLGDPEPQEVRLIARQLLPSVPPAVDAVHEKARRKHEKKIRPVYWQGIDWRQKLAALGHPAALDPQDQGAQDTCSGFAVVHALRANIAIHRNQDIPDLNPYFVWGIARERAKRPGVGEFDLLLEALRVVNNYGTPSGPDPTYAEVTKGSFVRRLNGYALEFRGGRGPEDASVRKVQSIVDLGVWLGDWSSWLHAYGPIVVRMVVDRVKYAKVTPENPYLEDYEPGHAFDGELTTRYASHDVVVVGYVSVEDDNPRRRDSFIVMNSYGKGWGENGFAYISVPEAQKSFRAGYGLLFREHLGYTWAGRPCAAARSALPDME